MYPSEIGVLILEFRGGHVCTAVNYKGESGRSQLCGSVCFLHVMIEGRGDSEERTVIYYRLSKVLLRSDLVIFKPSVED